MTESSRNNREPEYEVTLLELFFDLAFVFGISQFSQYLLKHLSWRGAAETLVMLMAVLAVWSYTSWAATMIQGHNSRIWWMLLAVTFFGLFMNAAIPRAFTTFGWEFVVPLLLIQLGSTVWTIANALDAMNRNHYVRVLLWFLVTTPFWILGAAMNPDGRLLWWIVACGVELIGTWLAHPIPGRRLHSENVAFDADHMLERCRLFLIIALGETVLTTGTAISHASVTLITLLTGTFAFLGTLALWALSFGRSYRLILQHLEETCDPIRDSRHAINVLMVLVAGLIAVAVANQQVIAHPKENTSVALSLLLFGGPVYFVLAQCWYHKAVLRVSSRPQLAGSAVLVVLGCAALRTPAYVALILVGIGLLLLVMVDWRYSIGSQVTLHDSLGGGPSRGQAREDAK
jgi:low temperature requirement protein LtrA